jgi:peptidylprolyl isomerase
VGRVRELAREGFFDGAPFTRVVEGFLAELRLRPLDEPLGLPSELLAPAPVTPTPIAVADVDRNRLGVYAEGDVTFGMYKGMSVAERSGGQPEFWVSHCPGVVSRAPSESGEGDNFVLMLGEAPSLDREGEPWGRVILGFEAASELAAGSPLSPETADTVVRARPASDLAPRERAEIYASFGTVLDESSPGFAEFTESLRDSLGRAPRVCEIRLPNSATAVRPER